jgi:transposase InsO family protein
MTSRKTYTRLFREQFVEIWYRTRDETSFVEHCERLGVSRETGYDWLRRYESDNANGLQTKSSAPHHCPHETDEETVALLIAARKDHPTWGPRKLKAWLEEAHPWELDLPAPSTIGDILKRAGLISSRKRKRRSTRFSAPFRTVAAPNDVWTTDFKGQFRTRDRRYCYPLTLIDCFSRYILRCDGYLSASGDARASFEAAFIEYGLPSAIRSDNGTPFASSHAPAGLSKLSVWWIRLGITPERITPASPWENGRHERMHRTLKEEATRPPQANRKQQQLTFDAFRDEFNYERPHEALGQKTPATFYGASGRHYPKRLRELEYPDAFQLRRVSDVGVISWGRRRVFITNVLRGEVVGLCAQDDATDDVFFGPLLLGRLRHDKPDLGLVRKLDDVE